MLVSGGRLIDPSRNIDARLDLRTDGSTIAEIGEHLQPHPGEDVFDARGAYVAPGFIDMHVHLREPGNPEKETLDTGTAAAAAGGFTAVAAMPNTNPAIDSPELTQWLARGKHSCRVYPIAAITKGRGGAEPVDYDSLEQAGAVAFSDDGSTIADGAAQARAAIASGPERLFITHCEDDQLKAAGYPDLAEDVIVARDALMAARYGKRWHLAHVSTAASVEFIRWIRTLPKTRITCEVTPHHLVFTSARLAEYGGRAKVNPPLRSAEDVEALRGAVRDGTIDAFASDHAPHTHAEKNLAVEQACVGFSGLEIAAGAYAHAVPGLPLGRFVELLSTNPARILRVPGGTLEPGAPADVTIFADREWTVNSETFRSKGKSTPFEGMRLPRMILATIARGKMAYRA